MKEQTGLENFGQLHLRGVRAALLHSEDLAPASLQALSSMKTSFDLDVRSIGSIESLSSEYSIIGLLDIEGNSGINRILRRFECLKIGFVSRNSFAKMKTILKYADAGIICGLNNNSRESLIAVVHGFFQSLLIPSLFNIDIADVSSIAKGIGLSFIVSGDTSQEIVEKLPKECYVAKSGLLHFSCTKDITLQEVYDVTKAVTLKNPGRDAQDSREFRRMNIKMGMRLVDETDSSTGEERKRMRLTAILFGI